MMMCSIWKRRHKRVQGFRDKSQFMTERMIRMMILWS